MGILDLFKRRHSTTPPVSVDARQDARDRMQAAWKASASWQNPFKVFTGEKYGTLEYSNIVSYNYTHLRRNSRGVYHESNIASGIVTRLVDNVVNVGLTYESTPLWAAIPDAPTGEDQRYNWTQNVEAQWKLYADCTEADIEGLLTFQQLQRKVYRLSLIDGEQIGIIRYLNSPRRMSPVSLQLIKPEQLTDPTSRNELTAIKNRGGTVGHGIEKDSTGKIVAFHIRDNLTHATKRVAMYGPKTGRRFIIYFGNFEAVGQERGFPELSKIVYELKKLTDYDIAELEAVVSQSAWFATIEADVDANPIRKNLINPNVSNKTEGDTEPKTGVETIQTDKFSLIANFLEPGQTFKGFQPTRPNPNYNAFVEAFETRIAGTLGIPRSVLSQKFQSSYSAARAEILFFWNTVLRRRHDLIHGFLNPFYESWFSEQYRAGNISAPGFELPVVKRAWLHGSWTGISRPVVDPVKEVKATESRLRLGHTTGEKEAKAYNGSDYRENVERLKTENTLLSEANKSLNPAQYADPADQTDDGGDNEND